MSVIPFVTKCHNNIDYKLCKVLQKQINIAIGNEKRQASTVTLDGFRLGEAKETQYAV